jgi:hypothetical protein
MKLKFLLPILSLFLILQPLFAADAGQEQIIARNGATDYVIVLSTGATPAEKTAAEQLKKYLDQVTGATFAIQSEAETSTIVPQIIVGQGERAKQLLGNFDWAKVAGDGIVLQTGPSWIVLAGDRPRGTLYAVYEFLENVGGVRWWASKAETVPSKPVLAVPALHTLYVPPFPYREHFTNVACSPDKSDPIFTTTLRENGHFNHQKDEWGGHYTILGWCHTLPMLIPTEKYFKAHPEWFVDPANKALPCTASSPMPHNGTVQVCFGAPGLAEETAKNALEWIRKDPKAGYISISQADGAPFCESPEDKEIIKNEGSESAIIIAFVNQVAEIIHKEYPDFMVETLAYVQTEKAPKTVVPGPNVIVRLAPIHSDYGHPMDSVQWNKDVHDNLENWSAIAPRLFVWNYMTNFTHCLMPHPNWDNLAGDIRYFVAHNAKGLFEQGNNYTNGAGDFVELRAWVIGKLMWNPERDQNALIDEFLPGYYGPVAGPLMRQYLDLYQAKFDAQNRSLSTYNDDFTFLDLETMNQATDLFAQASEAVKDDPVLSRRLGAVKISLDMAWLVCYKNLKKEAKAKGIEFKGPEDLKKATEDFLVTAANNDVGLAGEGHAVNQRMAEILKANGIK